jgi:uncharacterized membrane protein
MLIYVAILAYLMLGETLTGQQVVGLVLTALGAVVVQIQYGSSATPQNI